MEYCATRVLFGNPEWFGPTRAEQASAVTDMTAQIKNDDAALRLLLGPGPTFYEITHKVIAVDAHLISVLQPDQTVVFEIAYRVEAITPF